MLLKIRDKILFLFTTPFYSFRGKLMLLFILCAVLPLILVGSISYSTSYDIARNKIIESTDLSSKQLASNLNNRMLQIEKVADPIQYYMFTLDNMPAYPMSSYMSMYENVKTSIISLGSAFNVLHISVFVDPALLYSHENYNFFPLADIQRFGIEPGQLVSLGIKPYWKFTKDQRFPYGVADGPIPVVTCFHAKMNVNGNRLEYAYGISLDCQEFSDMMSTAYSDSSISSYVVDLDSGRIIAHADGRLVGTVAGTDEIEQIRTGTGRFSMHENEYLVNPIYNGEWMLVTRIPYSYIAENTSILVSIILISLLCVLVITIFATIFLPAVTTKRINLLSDIVRASSSAQRGETVAKLTALLPKRTVRMDEVDLLIVTFKNMMETIDANFQKMLEMSLQGQRLKYQLLKSQINPHFLYNILDSIQTCQITGKIDTANQMIGDLAKFYRHILHNPDDFITIKEELEIAELYLKMELLCRNGNFSWSIHLDDGIENFKICKFTLQPILENCILHGMRSSQHLHIRIDVNFGDDVIIISIADDGAGIEAGKLQEIQNMLTGNILSMEDYGISNTNARLSGSEARFGHIEISSVLGQGTKVRIITEQRL